ncbi:diguanylate cyclase [Caenimonas sedimenti]|uniref:Diguanylate cyclase n=1 Tax=Caenimonas sedimenti TaxID=2596921 RepID=A0A562ZU45_9BURK|nr:7TM diverse intracellular signaling domain-containing protein [Caenimonas sedimenti]TWO71858.1 diguanylate cyclase [Caenimonas sedimenti]
MDTLAAGFWGAFFGTAALMLAVSLAAYVRSQKQVALMAGLSAVISAAFVVAYLGWLPLHGDAQARLLAHVAVATAVSLALMLMSMLGLLRQRAWARRAVIGMVGMAVLVLAAGWMLPPTQALALSSVAAFSVGLAMLVTAVRSALRGDRLAWASVSGVTLMLVAVGGLSWIALDRDAPWAVHAMSATAGMAYLAVMATALWSRYSYLLELSEVMAHGPNYDPVTRMRSHSETGQMVGDVFFKRDAGVRPVGVIAICIANLYALENLHGRAAFNHALFICASRLRRCAPVHADMGRLGEDGFLLLVRHPADIARIVTLARQMRERLARPVLLGTSADVAGLEAAETAWEAELGIGILTTTTQVRPSHAVSTVRAMARTAWSYSSRLAYYDQQAGQIAELPLTDTEAAHTPG